MPIDDRTIEAVLALADGVTVSNRPVLIAIDGLGGAGKSTLAEALRVRSGHLAVVHADDFYGPEERDWATWTAAEGYERYFDHRRLEAEVLLPLAASRRARFQRYDWLTKSPGDWLSVDPSGVVAVEGVYLLRPRLRRYWDVSVYVDVPRQVRHDRLHARGENDAGWIGRWMRAEDYYEATVDPARTATLVISGAAG